MNTVKINVPNEAGLTIYDATENISPWTVCNFASTPRGKLPFWNDPSIVLDPNGYVVLSPRGSALLFDDLSSQAGLLLTVTGYNTAGNLQSEVVNYFTSNVSSLSNYTRIVSIVSNQAINAQFYVYASYPLSLNNTKNYSPIVNKNFSGKIEMVPVQTIVSNSEILIEGEDILGNRMTNILTLLSSDPFVETTGLFWKINRISFFSPYSGIRFLAVMAPAIWTSWINLNAQSTSYQARVQVFPVGTIRYQILYTYSPTYRANGIPVTSASLPVFQPQADYISLAADEVIPPQATGVQIRIISAGADGTLTVLAMQQGIN